MKSKRNLILIYLAGLATAFALALLTTGCGTLFKEDVQQIPELPPGTNTLVVTNLVLGPEVVDTIKKTGGMFGTYGEIGAGVIIAGLSAYLGIRNKRLRDKLAQSGSK